MGKNRNFRGLSFDILTPLATQICAVSNLAYDWMMSFGNKFENQINGE